MLNNTQKEEEKPKCESTPPTDSNWEEELKKKFDCHQTGCSYRKKGKWIMIACDMNCYNIIVGFIANQISSTLQQERQREREDKLGNAIDDLAGVPLEER